MKSKKGWIWIILFLGLAVALTRVCKSSPNNQSTFSPTLPTATVLQQATETLSVKTDINNSSDVLSAFAQNNLQVTSSNELSLELDWFPGIKEVTEFQIGNHCSGCKNYIMFFGSFVEAKNAHESYDKTGWWAYTRGEYVLIIDKDAPGNIANLYAFSIGAK